MDIQKPKMVVIEDDSDMQDLISAFFKPKGFEMTFFRDAEQALAELKVKPDICDVILTDFRLPNMSGIELTQALKAQGVSAPIILMTAHQSAELAIEAVQAGAYDFVVKPLHFAQLQVSVGRALYLNKVHAENQTLKVVVAEKETQVAKGICGKSPGFVKALDLAKRASKHNSSILLFGESGTGKEVIAKAIHQWSDRKDKPFVAINCSAIPENLLESELFGYMKGAFTGAVDKKVGLFEEAEGGTLFLDEIGDLSPTLQAKLLRVLQERKIKRLGENRERNIDVRVISATHKNLRQEIATGKFREDLFFRLNVIPIALPPLRDRKEDIIPLADFFLKKYAALNGTKAVGFTKEAREYLLKYNWTGNVRELENSIERAAVLCSKNEIDLQDLQIEESFARTQFFENPSFNGSHFIINTDDIIPLNDVINRYIAYALKINNGAKDRTARDLNIDRKTLYRRVLESEQRVLQ
ncbi:MAG: sigma-54-dependent transcriptional regulator [Pseudobdellovibrionaceae bacterium]